MFNDLYGQATGSRGNFPYKNHRRMPLITVTGMPDGVPFKEPFSYGIPALKKILAQKSKIKMELIQPSLSGNVEPPSEDTTAAIREESMWQQLADLSPQSEVTHMDNTSPGTEDSVAPPPPQESTDVPGNVEVLPTLSTNVEKSGVPNAIVKKSQWKAEEVSAVQLHFKEELEGRQLVQMVRIKKIVEETKFNRTALAVQNFLLRRRKEHRT